MYQENPYQQYRQNSIKSAGKGQLTLMLYDGAARFVKQGIKSLETNNIQSAHDAIVRAQEIIAHLNETLNPDYELSGSLKPLYDYINRRLMEANMKKDGDMLCEVLDLISQLRDAWSDALKLAKAPMASGQ